MLSWVVCALVVCTLLAPTTSSPLTKHFSNPKLQEDPLSPKAARGETMVRGAAGTQRFCSHTDLLSCSSIDLFLINQYSLIHTAVTVQALQGLCPWVPGWTLHNSSIWPEILGL